MFCEDPFHQDWVPGEEDRFGTHAGPLVFESRLRVVGLHNYGQCAVCGEAGVPPELAGREGKGLEHQLEACCSFRL